MHGMHLKRGNKMTEIKLGDEVIDKITGLKGIAIAKCEYLYGCKQFQIQPKAKDNKIIKGYWIDEPQLKLSTAAARNKRLNEELRNYGGVRDHPEE